MNKVLIIDDDKELCALIKRSVLSEDIEADFCNMGKEGLQKLKEREYQLVILDVMMPGMDGFETLEEIRKESSLPILMFTSKNDSASKVRGLRAGADDYLTKPFDMDELIARIVAHELFHAVEERHVKEIYTRTERVELWRKPFSNKSTISCLSEIAAMAFAGKLLDLKVSPYMLDVLLVYSYDKNAAWGLYDEIMNMTKKQ